MQGDHKPEPFLVTGFSESDGVFSPDGRFIAYVSDETGEPEIYVRSFPAGAGRQVADFIGRRIPASLATGRQGTALRPEPRQIHER
jgi:Tol biopolymer transport system component